MSYFLQVTVFWRNFEDEVRDLNRTPLGSVFPAFRLELKHQLFLGLEPASLQTGMHTIRSPGSASC